MTGGNYSNVSTVLAGSRIYASILKTAIEAIDQKLYDFATGAATQTPAINGGTIDNAVIGGATPKAVTGTVLTAAWPSAILASDVQALVLKASFSATGKGHTIDWQINGDSHHPLRIAGMFNAGAPTGMDMVFYTGIYNVDGTERLRIDYSGAFTFAGPLTINNSGNNGIFLNTDGNSGVIRSRSYNGSPTVSAGRANGSLASPTKVLANDFLGFYRWDGHDGSGWSGNAGAQFYVQAPADWSPTSHPTRIIFQTTASGATSPSSALTLDSDQSANFNGAVIANAQFKHTGSTFGAFNTTPASRPSAYTQTYATATRTHSNPTATALTAASGTADGTVADVGTSFSQTTLNNNFKDLATAINALIVDVANVKQVLNSVIDDQQTLGFFQ